MSAAIASIGIPASAALASQANQAARTATHRTKPAAALSALSAARGISRTGVLTGIVRGAADIPLARTCVSAAGAGVTRHAVTDSSGRYTLTALRPATYRISVTDCASPASYQSSASYRVTVPGGRYTAMHPITLTAASPAAGIATERAYLHAHPAIAKRKQNHVFMSGIVRSKAGKPLGGMCVDAWVNTKYVFEEIFWSTSKNGRYVIPNFFGIFPGKWHVLFTTGCGSEANYAPQWWDHAPNGHKATPLKATAKSHFTNINASLGKGGEITGVVTGKSKHGPRLAGVCASAIGVGGMSMVFSQVSTRGNGVYHLDGLGTGKFRVSFSPFCGSKGNYLSKNVGTISATAGKTRIFNVFLLLGGQITGTITSATGDAPIKFACADLSTGNEVRTGKTGFYAFHHLRPGDYQIAFGGGCGNSGSYAPQYYKNQESSAGAATIVIKLGTNKNGVNAALQPGGTISGVIINQGTGSPLAAACVVPTSQQGAGGFGTSLTDQILEEFTFPNFVPADPDGRYSFSNLAPGQYVVQVTPDCYAPVGNYASAWYSPDDNGSPEWLSVNAGTPVTSADIQVPRGGTITGKVTNSAGQPLPNVCAFPVGVGSLASSIPNLLGVGAGFTLAGGKYRVSGLAAGQYAVEFEPCDGQRYAIQWYDGQNTQATANPVTVLANEVTSGVDGMLNRGGTITGKITAQATGKPVRFACVVLADSDGNIVFFTQANKTGSYSFLGIAAGTYSVQPSQCDALTPTLAAVIKSGVTVTLASTTKANIALPAAGTVTGTVTAPGATAGTCVEATPVSGDGQPGIGVVGPDGSYVVPGLAAGSYQVLFTQACVFGVPGLAPALATSNVTVNAGATTTGVDATLARDGTIAGTVTSASTDGALSGICVGAFSSASASAPTEVAVSNPDGSYQLQNLAAGSYIVEFSAGCGTAGYVTQWWQDASTAGSAKPVTVTAGGTAADVNASMAAS